MTEVTKRTPNKVMLSLTMRRMVDCADYETSMSISLCTDDPATALEYVAGFINKNFNNAGGNS